MVASRIFGIAIGDHQTDAFVAYADMLNHKRPRQTSWYFCDKRQGFVIDALEDIPRGEQIFDSYGKKCNTRFLLNYGFINLNNDANEFPITVGIQEQDSLYGAKLEIIGSAPARRTYRLPTDFEDVGQAFRKLMSWLRFIESDDLNLLIKYKTRALMNND